MMRGFLSLGSNLGDRENLLRTAIERLKGYGVPVLKASHIYETPPVEVENEQGKYLNMVIEISFDGDPAELLDICGTIEAGLGRERPYRHAPRTMDIDILLLEGVSMNTDRIVIPHPRLEQRAFVMYPLAEISPDQVMPSGKKAAEVKYELWGDEMMHIWNGYDG
jgi:2-amino-4-hydroxy-6-hydroxymethyldihydropteridine diphosphokinase